MGLIFSKTGSTIIKGGSMIGNHEINIYDDHIVAKDSGGIFVSEKTIKAHFIRDNVRITIDTDDYLGYLNEITIKSPKDDLELNFYADLDEVHKILFESQLDKIKITSSFEKIDGLLQHTGGLTYVSINYSDKQLKLIHAYGYDDIFLRDMQRIQQLSDNIFLISFENKTYKVYVNNRALNLLNQALEDMNLLSQLGDTGSSIELKYKTSHYIAFHKGSVLEIYHATTLKLAHTFDIDNVQLYLGDTYLLIKHSETVFVCENSATKKLCVLLNLIPRKLHQLSNNSFLIKKHLQRNLKELICWLDEERTWYFYELSANNLIDTYLEHEVKVSATDINVIVLVDGLLKVGTAVDFAEKIETPTIYYSEAGFPMYFKREAGQVYVFIPGDILVEESVDTFYKRATKQQDNQIIVYGIADSTICLPLDMYKSLYKAHLYELRMPTLEQLHTEKVLLSRARNMSDLLLFEFFGQWQIILDYVKREMMKTSFTEAQITQYGLYLYHATFQQRKRMEELSSKYPQFMYALSQDLTINPKLNQVYQKQQKEMFQLAAQMKSQFTEIENLLSQITYIHFNNDEYQKRLKEAQNVASKKKVGVSIAAGIGIGIATGGVGLLIPAMTVFTEWINAEHRKELDEIQREKEFKKNEFLFKKAIDLILHMNDFTINYHVQMLNQFTYNNLRLEAEVLATDNSTAYKEKLLKQSIDMYTKVSLPIDYDTQLKPNKLVESILTAPTAEPEKTVSLFLE